ncbi:MAG: hypothetical protein Q9224_001033 [Gallowayella concinna]
MSTAEPETKHVPGGPLSTKSKVLETGALLAQSVPISTLSTSTPPTRIDVSKQTTTAAISVKVNTSVPAASNRYHPRPDNLDLDVRQCLIYDTPHPNARLIGIEYMISPKLYSTLDSEERRLWHSHVFEVKSGMLIMPGPPGVPTAGWEIAETKEMEEVIGLYGKTYHFWQVDRGDKLPLGGPELMGSFTRAEQLPEGLLEERDERYGISSEQKKEKRGYIGEPEVEKGERECLFLCGSGSLNRADEYADADVAWQK